MLNGFDCPVTPRRWLDQCNPSLSNLIQETLQLPKADFLKDLYKLEGLLKYVDNSTFQKKWAAVKQSNKERLAKHIEHTLGFKVNTHAMFDVQIKVCTFAQQRLVCEANIKLCSVSMSTRLV